MTDAVLYVALFLALYFQIFALITFLSRDARLRRRMQSLVDDSPAVAVIVPCYNEQETIRGTIESLLALDYPMEKLEILLVNDGSTDGTRAVMDSYAHVPQIRIIHKGNGGKHTALNAGLRVTRAAFVGCLDADSFAHPGALREILSHFDHPQTAAVTASMTVHEPRNALEGMQYAEYLAGVALRHVLSTVNGLYVTPGPFSFYRREVVEELGGFREGHKTEDMEMAMRLQRAGYHIGNAPRAKVYTRAPSTLWGLLKQRTRWTSGFIRNTYDYRDLFLNPRYGVLGLMVLPFGVLAIVAGMALFVLTLYRGALAVIEFAETQGNVPITYTLSPTSLDWFYVPVTGLLILGVVGVSTAIMTMIIGKRISGTRGRLGVSVLWYLVLYSLVAPLWLFRSTRDVALGYRTNWR